MEVNKISKADIKLCDYSDVIFLLISQIDSTLFLNWTEERNREFTDTVQIFDIIFTLIHRREERWINLRSRPATIFRYRVFRQPESRKGIKLFVFVGHKNVLYNINIVYMGNRTREKFIRLCQRGQILYKNLRLTNDIVGNEI